jgi:maltoporin
LVAAGACLGAGTLSARTSDADIAQLKAQMRQMQEDNARMAAQMRQMQEDNAKMAAEMKAMQAQVALSASVAKSRTLTGPDGKAINLEGPVLLPAFDSFTRNFKWSAYARVGVGFTGNGVGQTSDFKVPDFPTHGRFRLGNENDTYFDGGPILTHMLGDDPDVMDVRFQLSLKINNDRDKQSSVNLSNAGFDIGIRQMFLEVKNVIKSAPEVTFWAGQRYYDRYDIHPQDYFFVDTSGYGGGVYDIDVGVGKLALAYFGGIREGTGDFLRDNFNQFNLEVNGGQGDFYRHTFDVRLGDIDAFHGKLKLVLLGAYQQGGTFTNSLGGEGHVSNSGGAGGGFIYQYDLPKSWGKGSFVQLAALYGWGLVDFDRNQVDLNKLSSAYNSALAAEGLPPNSAFADIDPFNNSQRARANIFWVWNPTDNFSMGTWATYQFDDQGFTSYRVNSDGSISSASPDSNLFTVGVRPVYWIWGPFAIQGSFGYAYLSNNRVTGTGAAFGEGGSLGVFSIAPTIKPRGGFFTRPELRVYATYAVWSDSLKGSIGSPYYANSNMGWNFGVQAESWW